MYVCIYFSMARTPDMHFVFTFLMHSSAGSVLVKASYVAHGGFSQHVTSIYCYSLI